LAEFGFYKDPEKYTRERAHEFFLPSEIGGQSIPKIEVGIRRLIKNRWKYSPATKIEWFDFLFVDISVNTAVVKTEERWFAPVLDENDVRVPSRKIRMEWKAVYLIQKVGNKWFIKESTTPYKKD